VGVDRRAGVVAAVVDVRLADAEQAGAPAVSPANDPATARTRAGLGRNLPRPSNRGEWVGLRRGRRPPRLSDKVRIGRPSDL